MNAFAFISARRGVRARAGLFVGLALALALTFGATPTGAAQARVHEHGNTARRHRTHHHHHHAHSGRSHHSTHRGQAVTVQAGSDGQTAAGGQSSGGGQGSAGAEQAPARPALCENGVAPTLGADGQFACRDGSEPECEEGDIPVATHSSHNPTKLLCKPEPEEEPLEEEAEDEAGE